MQVCNILDSICIAPLLTILNIFLCLLTIQVSCFESAYVKSCDHFLHFDF